MKEVQVSRLGYIKSALSPESVKINWAILWDGISLTVKSSGLILWFCVFILALLEIKHHYNIDVIPNYDSSVDDAYGIVKGTISEFFH